MNQSISWAGSLELFPIFTSAEILWKSGFGRGSRLALRWERIVSHQRTLFWLRCDGSAHWIIEQPQSFHCLRIRFDSLSFHIALSTIDDWVTLEVHYPLMADSPTLWFIGLLPTITMKPSGIFLCAQHSLNPRRSGASCWVISPAYIHRILACICAFSLMKYLKITAVAAPLPSAPAGPVLVPNHNGSSNKKSFILNSRHFY